MHAFSVLLEKTLEKKEIIEHLPQYLRSKVI